MTIGAALALAATAAFNWWRHARCTSCTPRCPNKHQNVISGNQGMFAASMIILAVGLLEHLS